MSFSIQVSTIKTLPHHEHFVLSRYGERETPRSHFVFMRGQNDHAPDTPWEELLETEEAAWNRAIQCFQPDCIVAHGWWTNPVYPSSVPVICYYHVVPQYMNFDGVLDHNHKHVAVSQRSQDAAEAYLQQAIDGFVYPVAFADIPKLQLPTVNKVANITRCDKTKNCQLGHQWFGNRAQIYTKANFDFKSEDVDYEFLKPKKDSVFFNSE